MKQFKNKVFLVIATLSLGIILQGCFSNDTFTDFTKVAPVIEFLDAIPGKATAVDIDPALTDQVIELRLNVTGEYAPSSDVAITLGIGNLSKYNSDNSHVPGTLMPPAAYTLDPSVIIKAGIDPVTGVGNRNAIVKLTLHTSKVPTTPGVNYVIPVNIIGVPAGYVLSGNFGQILFNFFHNPYDGDYTETGTLDRQGNATNVLNETVHFTTISNTRSSSVAGFQVFGNPGISFLIDVNPDNTVTINADPDGLVAMQGIPSGGAAGSQGKNNSYDPATKTFYLNYQYINGSGLTRIFHVTLVHL